MSGVPFSRLREQCFGMLAAVLGDTRKSASNGIMKKLVTKPPILAISQDWRSSQQLPESRDGARTGWRQRFNYNNPDNSANIPSLAGEGEAGAIFGPARGRGGSSEDLREPLVG